jgi:hypothetical protein
MLYIPKESELFGILSLHRSEIVLDSPTLSWGICYVTFLMLPSGDVLNPFDFRSIIRGCTSVEIIWLKDSSSSISPFYANPIILLSTLESDSVYQYVKDKKEDEVTNAFDGLSKLIKQSFGENCGLFVTTFYCTQTGQAQVTEI